MSKALGLIVTPEQFDALPLAQYEFALRARGEAVLPPFLGTSLRGAFGHAWKAIACAMPHGECGQCVLAERCRYTLVFETPAGLESALLRRQKEAPRPFLFVPPLSGGPEAGPGAPAEWLRERVLLAPGETLPFGLTLLGAAAIRDAPYFVYAVSLMAQHGLGVERAGFDLLAVWARGLDGSTPAIYAGNDKPLAAHEAQTAPLGAWVRRRLAEIPAAGEITLCFVTPTRLREKGRTLPTTDFPTLVKFLSLRLATTFATHGAAPLEYDYYALLDKARAVRVKADQLYRRELRRRSNRQEATLDLDGFMGTITFAGANVTDFLPLLAAGELMHVGSSTPFGLGRYRLL